MKKVLLVSVGLCFAAINISAQQFICKTGKVHFFSATPLEDIEATTHSAVGAINSTNKKVYTKILITSFKFHDKLMEEHFNENYLESDKFPYGILDMVMQENLDYSKDTTYDVTLKGTLEMHGVKHEREIKGKLLVKNGVPLTATSKFNVKLADHNIKIPTAVAMKIAEALDVDVEFTFEKYEKK